MLIIIVWCMGKLLLVTFPDCFTPVGIGHHNVGLVVPLREQYHSKLIFMCI